MDIGEIYKKSFYITKKFKYLWIVGLVVIASGATGLHINYNGVSSHSTNNINLKDSSSVVTDSNNVDILKNSLNELDTEMSNDFDTTLFMNVINIVFKNMNNIVSVKLLLVAIGIFILSIIITIAIKMIIKAWAVGGLIGGIMNAIDKDKVLLEDISMYGKRNFKNMLLLLFIPKFVLSLFVITVALIFIGISSVIWNDNFNSPDFLIPFFGIILFLGFFVFILLILYRGIMIYAERLCIYYNLSWVESFKKGFVMFKSNLIDTILLAVVNWILATGIGIAFLGISAVAVLFGGILLYISSLLFMVILIILSIILIVPIIIFFSAFTGAFTTFKYSTWNVLFLEKISKRRGYEKKL